MNTGLDELKWEWKALEETDSTNRVALERVQERWGGGRSAAGVVVTARRQTAGRGQHGRRWESPVGGLYLSAVLEQVPMELRERLALAAGVCVVEALESLGARGLQIRWPNDVVMEGRAAKKLAGILCEAVAQGERWAVVMGMGVNVAAAPAVEGVGAASLAELGVRVTPRVVAETIVARLGGIPAARLEEVVAEVRRRDGLRGQALRLNDGTRVWEGVGAGLDDAGRLMVTLADGTMRAFERGTLHG